MKGAALAPLALLAAPLAAQEGPQPFLKEGETIEVETRGDFNGDGVSDLAYIVRDVDRRELRVAVSFRTEVEIGEYPAQVLALDPYPLGSATLTVKGKVLLLEDLTGGTTAVASTHRFRWDRRLDGMRLIGLDATLYSRTFAHDGSEASWNLLTGDLVTRNLRLNRSGGDAAYDRIAERRTRRPSPPLRLEDAPAGDALLGEPNVQ